MASKHAKDKCVPIDDETSCGTVMVGTTGNATKINVLTSGVERGR